MPDYLINNKNLRFNTYLLFCGNIEDKDFLLIHKKNGFPKH